MIRLSQGSAIELGLIDKCNDIPPTTAYIMIGDKCNNRCSFCSQSTESSSRRDKLSRVIWPEYSKEDILQSLKEYTGRNIRRICIQSMYSEEAHNEVLEFIKYIKPHIDMPISLSAKIENDKDLDKFFGYGIDKVGIAIDAANKDLYQKIKGGNFEEKVNFIVNTAKKYPNKISTHIIVGLGETHEEIYEIYSYLIQNGITVSLFAFTPVKGTEMENIHQPPIDSYRKVQLMTYMIERGYLKDSFTFNNGNIESIEIDDVIKSDIQKGYPFEIRGCKDCNRPYYNERPGKTIYNYSKKLSNEQVLLSMEEIDKKILKES